jgi:hypothetical protein
MSIDLYKFFLNKFIYRMRFRFQLFNIFIYLMCSRFQVLNIFSKLIILFLNMLTKFVMTLFKLTMRFFYLFKLKIRRSWRNVFKTQGIFLENIFDMTFLSSI